MMLTLPLSFLTVAPVVAAVPVNVSVFVVVDILTFYANVTTFNSGVSPPIQQLPLDCY